MHTLSAASGLVDRLFAVHAGSRVLDSHRRHFSESLNDFSDPTDQDILSWEIVVEWWRSVIAVSAQSVLGRVSLEERRLQQQPMHITWNQSRLNELVLYDVRILIDL